jgi:hypothetical protein
MNLSGLVLDFYDEPRELTEIFPNQEDVPENIKCASALSPEEHGSLPDHVFALVLRDGDHQLRKYACIDSGNTELAVHFFLKNAHKLPEEAQKTAAANLIKACGWYDLQPPDELEKIALGIGTGLRLAIAPMIASDTAQQAKANMAAQSRFAPGTVITPQQQQAAKMAEASGTYIMPNQAPGKLRPVKKATITKTAEQETAKPQLETTQGTSGEQVQKLPQGKDMQPYVDVGSKQVSTKAVKKEAQFSAIGKSYPLEDYGQVKMAAAYYEENSNQFNIHERREFCVNLVKRASALGIVVSEEAQRYGSEKYASMPEIQAAIDLRRPFVDAEMNIQLDGLLKHAGVIDPDVFCATLGVLDRQAQIDWMYDRNILDPYLSTFGIQKQAEDENWSQGVDYVTRKQIENYAVTGLGALTGEYGDDFSEEFRKDPWGIFMSLPVDQKRRIARAAGDNSSVGKANVA